jgi:CO dehydrogenase nickel-insertion accessory protein CooC1
MICGKGGRGKSTITTLWAQALNAKGKRVLVVDADESHQCLHRLLGAQPPVVVMDAMGGRLGSKHALAAIPRNPRLFLHSLDGKALTEDVAAIQAVCRFIETFKKPVSLATLYSRMFYG